MDRKLPRQQQIEQLIRSSEQSRRFLTAEVRSLKAKLDVPARVRSSLKGNPGGWMLGSAASGLFASLLFRRKPAKPAPTTVVKEASKSIGLLALILTVVQPLAKIWLTGHLKSYLAGGSSRLVSFSRK